MLGLPFFQEGSFILINAHFRPQIHHNLQCWKRVYSHLKTKELRFWKACCCRKDNQESNCDGPVDSGDKPLVAPSTTYVSYRSCVQHREPLLDTQ